MQTDSSSGFLSPSTTQEVQAPQSATRLGDPSDWPIRPEVVEKGEDWIRYIFQSHWSCMEYYGGIYVVYICGFLSREI